MRTSNVKSALLRAVVIACKHQVSNETEGVGDKVKEVEEQLTAANQLVEDLKRQVKELERTNDGLEEEVEKVTAKYTDMKKEHDALVAELNDL